MSTPAETPTLDIYNTEEARKYRQSHRTNGHGPSKVIPEPPYHKEVIEKLQRQDLEDHYIYNLLTSGWSYAAAARKASAWFGYKISKATITGRVARWREAEARKINETVANKRRSA